MILRRAHPAVLLFVLSIAAPSYAAAQNAAADVSQGKKLFDGMCARCHGIDGTGDEGPSLNHPTLTRAGTDDALREVIRDGIPDRGMPRVRRLSENEVEQLVAYVRSLGRASTTMTMGNVEKGRATYDKLA